MDTDGNGILDKEEFIKAYMAYKSQGAKKMVDCSETGAAVSAMSSNTGQAAPATASTAGASAMTMTGVAKATDNASAEGLELISDVLEQEAEDMFTRMDLNQDGYIGISEWLAVTLDDTYVANRARLSSAFSVFDIDGNGEIDIQEFIDILQPSKKSQPELKNYVEKFDLDHNGKLSFEEFCKVIENTPQDVIKKTETKE
ncbi:EF-hand protein [Gregarina niphandrodes]|uniref:EF-hand protein n=1 Tax=Gregarina niphandrodes TaxID=110365 RepID=A0A023BDU2_GRENI|nr:EF-hand protein [Gregarina niphandrodes]EZG89433.1 EF-hand protein [Gregarina niphandrodes]|eukprot:XP_011128485.1 EF-hand protein [Gregarina niphandrodes]